MSETPATATEGELPVTEEKNAEPDPGSTIYDDFYAEEKWMTEGTWVTRPGAKYSFHVVYCGPLNRTTQRQIAEMYLADADINAATIDDGGEVVVADDDNKITIDFLVKHAVKGWRGMTSKDGKPLKFTPSTLRALLEEMPVLVDWLWARCQSTSYYGKAVAAAVKN